MLGKEPSTRIVDECCEQAKPNLELKSRLWIPFPVSLADYLLSNTNVQMPRLHILYATAKISCNQVEWIILAIIYANAKGVMNRP